MSGQDYEQLTLFPADFLASLSPSPGSDEARATTVSSGRKWLGLSKNSGPLGSLEKMLLESSTWHSTKFFLNWIAKDTPHGHFYFQLMRSERGTCDTASPLWATPTSMDAMTLWPTPIANDAEKRGNISTDKRNGLSAAGKIYATPTANDAKNTTLPPSQIKRDSIIGDILREQEIYPTPRAQTANAPSHTKTRQGGADLQTVITDAEKMTGGGVFRAGADRRAAQSGVGGMAYGLSDWMDADKYINQYWDAEPQDVPRIAQGVPHRTERIRALGNAVVPQQFFPVFRAIAETIQQERRTA